MDAPLNRQSEDRRAKYALLVTALAPVLPQILGSAFNIWYNIALVDPLLGTAELKRRFVETVIVYNGLCYPVGVYVWLRLVYSLRPAFRRLHAGRAFRRRFFTGRAGASFVCRFGARSFAVLAGSSAFRSFSSRWEQ